MLELLLSPEAWISLAVLVLLEVVLGIDNIVFITILCARLPRERQMLARRLGIGFALISRLALLGVIAWIAHLEKALFTLWRPWSARDLILIAGGLFLLYKGTREIYDNVERPGHEEAQAAKKAAGATLAWILVQIVLLDMVFSLDSVITAVGMAEHVPVMVAAVVIAVIIMLVFAGPVGDFVQDNPSVRVLALAFLILVGAMLVMDGTGQHVPKAYLYAAMGFSLFVQVLNLRMDSRKRRTEGDPGDGDRKP